MNITIEQNKIIIINPDSFDIKHILECGQIFRYKNLTDHYVVYSLDKCAKIYTYQDRVEILTTDTKYFYDYFDLDTDYQNIKSQLSQFDMLKDAIAYGGGIRILKQNLFEMIISFIISANNNIKRIQGIIEKLCTAFGTNMGEYYAFPTIDQLKSATSQFYKSIGAGYRSEYLVKVISQLTNGQFDLNCCDKYCTKDLRKQLITLSGVGPKVADCILLFGVGRTDVFPVDTWIQKVYNDQNSTQRNREQIAQYFVDTYGELSGYAQQYFFYNKRENA